MIVGNIIRLGVRAFRSTAMYDWIYLTQHPHIIQIHVIVWRWLSFIILTGEFRAQRASNTDNVPVWWRHHAWARFTKILRGCCIGIGVIIRLLRCQGSTPRPVFTEWTDVLPQDLVKYRSRRVGCCNGLIAHKIWQASWLRCCRGPCKISERFEKYKPKSRSFETSRDLAVGRSFANHNKKNNTARTVYFLGSRWRHQMETFSALLALCVGNSSVTSEFPSQRPMTRSFDASFDLGPNKRLSKQWWGRRFETPSCLLWRHCNGNLCYIDNNNETL